MPPPNTASEDWTLNDWLEAVGFELTKQPDARLARIAKKLIEKETGIILCDNQRFNALRRASISNHSEAHDMLYILRYIAQANHLPFFSGDRCEHDALLFMRSKACSQPLSLRKAELDEFCRFGGEPITEANEEITHLHELRSRVVPPPVERVGGRSFGRDTDIQNVLMALDRSPVTIIDGIAGEGKTTLAWYSLEDALAGYMFTDGDWVTDKRTITGPNGKVVYVPHGETEQDFLMRILRSAARRFGWRDLAGTSDLTRMLNKCADRLRKGRYLLVIDNLETVENNGEIIREIHNMLKPIQRLQPISSRALFTSRERFLITDCAEVHIKGLSDEACTLYIQFLERRQNIRRRLSSAEIERLIKAVKGNSLFLNMALTRYFTEPTGAVISTIINEMEAGTHHLFDTLFNSILKTIGEAGLHMARLCAQTIAYSKVRVDRVALHKVWEDTRAINLKLPDHFDDAIEMLLRVQILNVNLDETYGMHPLILSYLLTDLSKGASQ